MVVSGVIALYLSDDVCHISWLGKFVNNVCKIRLQNCDVDHHSNMKPLTSLKPFTFQSSNICELTNKESNSEKIARAPNYQMQ